MIPEQDQITCFKNKAGDYYFQIDGDFGTYHLLTHPSDKTFQIVFPDFTKECGSLKQLSDLYFMLESAETGLTRWIYRCLRWVEDPGFHDKQNWISTRIKIADVSYGIEFCNESDELILTIPGRTIVSYRDELATNYPEIFHLHHSSLGGLILDIVKRETKGGDLPVCRTEQLTLPIKFDPRLYTIENVRYWIDYDRSKDLLFIQIPMSIRKTPMCLLDIYSELDVLQGGFLKKNILEFVQQNKMV